ncbi:MAG: hypothetical protein LBG96_12785 [Tannerella sp.]|jgi:hypothetical protein|nr:hypothetical protein [Tannerella sp.]
MYTSEGKTGKPYVIANPIYDTVFKRLMENSRVAKFILGTILERQIEDLVVMPQEFTYKRDLTKTAERDKGEKSKTNKKIAESYNYYRISKLDFMATVRTDGSELRKILIEVQKTWHTGDVIRFRQYLGEQYVRENVIDGEAVILPITTIYILGNNLPEIDCPCVKVGRMYIDMRNKQPIDARSEFIEHLTHDSYVIQAGRITDVRYTTNLDKLLSIFEQKYFVKEDSETVKKYSYHPEDENMKLITNILHEMGVDPDESKLIEDEEKSLRYIDDCIDGELKEKNKTIKEKNKTIKEKNKTIKEQVEALKEKDEALKEERKAKEEQAMEIEELKRLLRKKR